MNITCGYPPELWSAAKEEARQELISVANRKGTIAYSILVTKIPSIQFDAHDVRLNALLGQISEDENKAGRGMLSVLVVHKEGSQQPGSGFFEWAGELGYTVVDRDAFWMDMLKKVHKVWSKK